MPGRRQTMNSRKSSSERKRGRVSYDVSKAIAQSRAESREFVKFIEQIARDPEKARQVLRNAGILTPTGRLTRLYRK